MTHEMIIAILSALLAVSEGLSLIPGLKSNSIFQLIVNGLKALVAPAPEVKK
jgi:hypothetical protein